MELARLAWACAFFIGLGLGLASANPCPVDDGSRSPLQRPVSAGSERGCYDDLRWIGDNVLFSSNNFSRASDSPSKFIEPPIRFADNDAAAHTGNRSQAGLPPGRFAAMKIGGGGYATGMDIAPDGTAVTRTNSGGAYVCSIASCTWSLVTSYAQLDHGTINPNGNVDGVAEIAVAHGATSTMYLLYNGYLQKSINKGATWIRLSSFAQNTNIDPNSPHSGTMGPLIAIDPQNKDFVFVSSPGTSAQQGLTYTTNGGKTFNVTPRAMVSQTPANGFFIIAFDPTSSVSEGKTQSLYACSTGHGCYRSTNAGANWTSIGGPSASVRIYVDPAGVVWVCDDKATVWRYNGSWSQRLANAPYGTVVADANNCTSSRSCHIFAFTYYGSYNASVDGGNTWNGLSAAPNVTASDIPWLATTLQSDMSIGHAVWDPTGSGKVYVSAGTGVFSASLSAKSRGVSPLWDSVTAAQETLVATMVLSPPGGKPVVLAWDRALFYVSDPKTYRIKQNAWPGFGILGGWSADYAYHTPTFIAAIMNTVQVSCAGTGLQCDLSGYSTDGGQTWKPFGVIVASPIRGGAGIQTLTDTHLRNLQFAVNDRVMVFQASNYNNWFNGRVAAYNSDAGTLSLNIENYTNTNPAVSSRDWLIHTIPQRVITGFSGGCIAVSDPTHMVWVPAQNADYPFYTTDGGKTWLKIDLTQFGVPTTGTTGWGPFSPSSGNAGCQVVADRVLANTFYLYNTSAAGKGLYTCITGDRLSCRQTKAGQVTGGTFWRMKSVPGKAGHLFMSGGDANSTFVRSSDGGATWAPVNDNGRNIINVQAFGFGASAPGQDYPSIYLQGYSTRTGVFGFYESFDGGAIWLQPTRWPNNDPSLMTDIDGDKSTAGYFYMGFIGSGFAYYGSPD
jgi:hypothetical protein